MITGRTRHVVEGKTRFNAYVVPDTSAGEEAVEGWELKEVPTKSMPVFYNPRMTMNRDISVAAVHAWSRQHDRVARVADVMCGAGFHGIRYLVEVPDAVSSVSFVDMNPAAIRAARENVVLNGIDTSRCSFHVKEANEFCFAEGKAEEQRHDIIDVDPFGNPVLYLQGAFRAATKTSMVQVNATDLAVLAGVHWKATRRKYQVLPLRGVPFHAELATRVLLGVAFRKAMEQDMSIKPLLSVARTHFVKIIIEKRTGASAANENFEHLGYFVQCKDCLDHFTVHVDKLVELPGCIRCGSPRLGHGGPAWTGPLHDAPFCQVMVDWLDDADHVQSRNQAKKILVMSRDEANFRAGSHDIHEIARHLGNVAHVPALDVVITALRETGFAATRDASNPTAIKTSAFRSDVERVLASR